MRRKLLLADDSITVQRVIELTFADEGLEIATVGDGTQAIARLQQDRADIVLADLNMPGADGYAVAEYVKRGSDLVGHTRVVLLTGAFEPVDEDRARLLGVDGVLAKPFEPQVAIDLVRQVLNQPPLAPPRPAEPERTAAADAGLASQAGAGPQTPQAAVQRDWTTAPATSDPTPPVAAGYPFEPGAATARSSPAELDDYFRRLDEALTSAGLTASTAVRDMLAESKDPVSAAPKAAPATGVAATGVAAAGTAAASAPAAPGPVAAGGAGAASGAGPVGERARPMTGLVGEERQMSGVPQRGQRQVTLVDAFSALLAAEQVSGAGPTGGLDFWAPTPSAAATSEHAAGAGSDAEAIQFAAAPGDAASGLAPAAPAITEAQIDAAVRRVLGEMSSDRIDALVRELIAPRVLEVAERLVREEIERLKASAQDDAH